MTPELAAMLQELTHIWGDDRVTPANMKEGLGIDAWYLRCDELDTNEVSKPEEFVLELSLEDMSTAEWDLT